MLKAPDRARADMLNCLQRGTTALQLSGEQVNQLQVLELGSPGGREWGAIPLFAHRVRDFEEGGNGAGRRDVTALEGYDRATHLRVFLYRYEYEVTGRDRPHHGRPGQ